ncbi:MAG: NADH-quinone oxidoreductase subunit NuoH [Phototrophicales bacterium]|nr:MAG: NADH-quinone oxidoreductase subunit NuoH [Phototrophicales bacterium]
MVGIFEDLGFEAGLAAVLGNLVGVVVLATVFLLLPIFTIWVERKVAARFQNRIGPNRVGPYGILQSFPDVVKLLGKELILPRNVDKIPYLLSPIIMVAAVVLIVAVIPLAPTIIGTDLSIGALYFVSVGSLTTIAIVMAGWGSNNKYALLGAFRTVAQLISYEIPLVFSLLIPILLVGSLSMQTIVEFQDTYWIIFYVPTAAVIFLVSNIAEIGRAPFDLIEAESELIAGYMIEYSGMAFAMFYLAEFLHAFLVAVIFSVLFLGGWQGPLAQDVPVLGIAYLTIKSFIVYFAMLWVRMTLPRFRIDHLMAFNWKFLVPVSIVHVLVTAGIWSALPEPDLSGGWFARLGEEFPRMALNLVASVVIAVVSLRLLRQYAEQERQRLSEVTAMVEHKQYPLATTGQGAQSNVIVVGTGSGD